MGKEKIAITIEGQLVNELDRLVGKNIFQSRSQAIQEAVREKLLRIKKIRLAEESAKLDPSFERALSEDGFEGDIKQWPEY